MNDYVLLFLLHAMKNFPQLQTIWEGADWYERELFDMFGVNFEGHPDHETNFNAGRLERTSSYDGIMPLRKNPVEFKHGVKPKVPSQIIPYVKSNQKNSKAEKRRR